MTLRRKSETPTLVKAIRTLGLILWPLVVVEADPGAPPNALEKLADPSREEITSHHQPGAAPKSGFS